MKKFLFLDIDGVLNSEKWAVKYFEQHKEHPEWDHGLDPEAVKLIDYIYENTESSLEIIISSSWRFTYDDTIERLRKQGLKCPVASPLTNKDNVDEHDEYICRGMLIHRFLVEHGLWESCGDYKHYVILDDDEDMVYWQRNNFINTNFRDGLTKEQAEHAIAILNSLV